MGDIISFGPNAGRIFRRWSDGAIAERLRPLSINLENHGFNIHKWTGELVHTQPPHKYDPTAPVFNGHRGELHTIVFNYAKNELGIPIHLGQRATEYFEDENQAGIVLESGEKVSSAYPLLCAHGGGADIDISSDHRRSSRRCRRCPLKGSRTSAGLL